jgi:hypothetical protein
MEGSRDKARRVVRMRKVERELLSVMTPLYRTSALTSTTKQPCKMPQGYDIVVDIVMRTTRRQLCSPCE